MNIQPPLSSLEAGEQGSGNVIYQKNFAINRK